MSLFAKIMGDQQPPPIAPVKNIVKAALIGLIALTPIAYLGQATETPLILGSFGATCVILGLPDSPFAQPRNVVGGHVIASLMGLICLSLLGDSPWALGVAVTAAIAAMYATGTVHPPAGSNPVIVWLTKPAWGFLLFPTLTGAVLLVLAALIYHNLQPDRRYPRYW